jgi:hypothetical protein
VQRAASAVQHATREHTTYGIQRALSQRNMDHPTGRKAMWHTTETSNMKHYDATCPHAMHHQTYLHSAQHKLQNISHTMQRTTHPMTLHATRKKANEDRHHRRACDAAALELHRPITHRHHATVLHTAAPLRLRHDRPFPATRTDVAEVSEIATDSNVTLPRSTRSTPPLLPCTRAQRTAARSRQQPPHTHDATCSAHHTIKCMQHKQHATCNGTHAVRCTPHDVSDRGCSTLSL